MTHEKPGKKPKAAPVFSRYVNSSRPGTAVSVPTGFKFVITVILMNWSTAASAAIRIKTSKGKEILLTIRKAQAEQSRFAPRKRYFL